MCKTEILVPMACQVYDNHFITKQFYNILTLGNT